jgi:hypothetical protein
MLEQLQIILRLRHVSVAQLEKVVNGASLRTQLMNKSTLPERLLAEIFVEDGFWLHVMALNSVSNRCNIPSVHTKLPHFKLPSLPPKNSVSAT